MKFRRFDPKKDLEACQRIWQEVGWLDDDNSKGLDFFLNGNQSWVAELDSIAECLVTNADGDLQYQDEKLSFSGVMGVTTSRVARKQGLASRLTALAIAEDAQRGALVSGLGMFEQGFYDQLGYGSGGYEHIIDFDPGQLKIDNKARPPQRLDKSHFQEIHNSRLNRVRKHGSVSFNNSSIMEAELGWEKKTFGLGYFNKDGALTHHLWARPKDMEVGPYRILWMSYKNSEGFLELMGLIKNFSEQVNLVSMVEPPGIQIQDLLKNPLRSQYKTRGGKFEQKIRGIAFWQMRICDLIGTMEKTHLRSEVTFNLELSDSIQKFLSKGQPWQGVAGEYVIKLGSPSSAERGRDKSLPTLKASVNSFTRLWLGVQPASGLAVTDDLAGSNELLAQLDNAFCLPVPRMDWEF